MKNCEEEEYIDSQDKHSLYFKLLSVLSEKKKDYSFSDFSEWEFSLDERDDDAPWVDVNVEDVNEELDKKEVFTQFEQMIEECLKDVRDRNVDQL